jgi:hypothetical protein
MSAATQAVEPMRVSTAAERTGRKPAGQRADRTWEGPSRRQRAYIARLTLELLGIPYPADEREASEVIGRLKNAVDAAKINGGNHDDIPF